MQIETDAKANLLGTAQACAGALAELDLALHSMELTDIQSKLAASMASQVILLRELAARIYDLDVPDDPVRLKEALAAVAS